MVKTALIDKDAVQLQFKHPLLGVFFLFFVFFCGLLHQMPHTRKGLLLSSSLFILLRDRYRHQLKGMSPKSPYPAAGAR